MGFGLVKGGVAQKSGPCAAPVGPLHILLCHTQFIESTMKKQAVIIYFQSHFKKSAQYEYSACPVLVPW